KAIVLTSEVDPMRYATARVSEARADRVSAVEASEVQAACEAEEVAASFLNRWARLLDGFQRARWLVPPAPEAPRAARPLAESLVAERLTKKYGRLVATKGLSTDEVDEAFEPWHWQLWRQCTRAEKLAVRHLAEEGFLNPNAQDIVRPLLRRLLIRRKPAFD